LHMIGWSKMKERSHDMIIKGILLYVNLSEKN
jgi:hypothetical protein